MAWRTLALAAWMVTWWITEAVPIPVTALLPLSILPLIGVMPIAQSTAPYASPIIFLFMGGFMLALGLEKYNLHTRIALNLIRLTGTHANGIILGFMIATAALSMWISNTATTVMMLPIAISVVDLLPKSNPGIEQTKSFKLFALSLLLSIAYAANIGGTTTIIGTPPNVVLVGHIREFYNIDLDFSTWLLIGIPFSFTLLAVTYLLITRVLFRNGLGDISGSQDLIHEQLQKLGKVSKEEKMVMAVFGVTAFSWIFRKPINQLIGVDILNDTIIAMVGGTLMFLLPTDFKRYKRLLDWESMKNLPWGILILFGGGLTLARALEQTGIIGSVGAAIAQNANLGYLILLAMIVAVMLFMTELMSNVALVVIFVPVVFSIAEGLGYDPIHFAIPVTLASSCAFMMPIATPPNAIVFSSGHIRMKDMMRAGFILNLVAIAILVLLGMTLVRYFY